MFVAAVNLVNLNSITSFLWMIVWSEKKKDHSWLSMTLLFLESHYEVCYSLFIELSDLYFPNNYDIMNPLSFCYESTKAP